MKKSLMLMASLWTCQLAFAEDGTISDAGEREKNRDWKVILGGGIASTPRYEGSASNRIRAVPLVEIEYGRFFAGASRGIGYNFSDWKTIEFGPRLSLAPYRRQNADTHLNGMGDIGYAGELGGFLNASFAPWYVASSFSAGSHGARMELDAGYATRLSPTDRLRAGLGLNWANSRYMQTYFGVSAAQAAASGGVLSAYNAGYGIKDYGLKINWMHDYSKQWFSNAGLSFKQISGSAAGSPLTMRRSMHSINFVVGYRF